MPRKGKKRREAARGRRLAERPPPEEKTEAPAAERREERATPARPRPPRERRRKQTAFPELPVAAAAVVVVVLIAIGAGALLLLGGDSSSGAGGSAEKDPFAGKTADITFTIDATGEVEDSRFKPDTVTAKAGQAVELVVKNVAETASHNIHVVGADKEYDTLDDCLTCGRNRLVSFPQAVAPGKTGHVIVKLDQPGKYAFRCDFHPQYQFGTLVLQ
jgi:uncharacterized cupredoxin-like copper-binding protein